MKILICITCYLILFTAFTLNVNAQELVLPQGFPEMDINLSEGTSEGYFFLGPMPIGANGPGSLIIMDDYGTPVFYRKTKMKTYAFRPYPNGTLAYFEGNIFKYVTLDSSYQSIDTMGCVGCDRFDIHELRILKDGGYLLAGFKYRIIDMSDSVPGGNPSTTIQDYAIQEFDVNGQLIFEWNTRDYYKIIDVNENVDLTANVIDPTSFCSIDVESDTSLLMSMAHQDEVTKVDRRTGKVIWRLGGKNNQFTFVNSTRPFTRQHHARRLPNGNITMMDNGTFSSPFYSRAVEYEIDEKNKIATQVWEFDHGKTIQSTHKGSVQRLPNGNTLIGWGGFGSNPAIPSATEVKPDGTIVFEMSTPQNDGSYRVLKFPWKTNLFEAVTDSVNFGNWNGYTESVYLLMIKNNSANPLSITSASLRTPYFYVDEQFPKVIPAHGQDFITVIFYPMGAAQNTKLYDVITINSDKEDKTQRIAIQVHLQGYVPDLISPVATVTPADGAINVNPESPITIQFNEPVRNLDNSELTNTDLISLLSLKTSNISGNNVPFSATINTAKTIITIVPDLLASNTVYYIALGQSLEDYNDNLSSPASSTFTTGIVSGSENNPENDLRIYPNPGNGLFTIEFSSQILKEIKVTDLNGKIILIKENLSGGYYQLDLSNIQEGLYFLFIESSNPGPIHIVKLIKQNEGK